MTVIGPSTLKGFAAGPFSSLFFWACVIAEKKLKGKKSKCSIEDTPTVSYVNYYGLYNCKVQTTKEAAI